MTETPKHPMQPLVEDGKGVLRFKENAIVRYLLDQGRITMNDLAALDFPVEDREQFAQLIGYSLGGYSSLSYVRGETVAAAARMATDGMDERDARIAALEVELAAIRRGLREPVARLFGVHPDDLLAGEG